MCGTGFNIEPNNLLVACRRDIVRSTNDRPRTHTVGIGTLVVVARSTIVRRTVLRIEGAIVDNFDCARVICRRFANVLCRLCQADKRAAKQCDDEQNCCRETEHFIDSENYVRINSLKKG